MDPEDIDDDAPSRSALRIVDFSGEREDLDGGHADSDASEDREDSDGGRADSDEERGGSDDGRKAAERDIDMGSEVEMSDSESGSDEDLGGGSDVEGEVPVDMMYAPMGFAPL